MHKATCCLGLAGVAVVLACSTSCNRREAESQKVMQQIAILGDEIRTANREIKLLRAEVAGLREAAGLSGAIDSAACSPEAGAACGAAAGSDRGSGSLSGAEPAALKPGLAELDQPAGE
jgi:hypothetical protein